MKYRCAKCKTASVTKDELTGVFPLCGPCREKMRRVRDADKPPAPVSERNRWDLEAEAELVDEGKVCDHVSFGLCPDCIRAMLTRAFEAGRTEQLEKELVSIEMLARVIKSKAMPEIDALTALSLLATDIRAEIDALIPLAVTTLAQSLRNRWWVISAVVRCIRKAKHPTIMNHDCGSLWCFVHASGDC